MPMASGYQVATKSGRSSARLAASELRDLSGDVIDPAISSPTSASLRSSFSPEIIL
jgi:hypothetical protein